MDEGKETMKKYIITGSMLCVCLTLLMTCKNIIGQKADAPVKRTLSAEQLQVLAKAIQALAPKPKLAEIPAVGASVGSAVPKSEPRIATNPTIVQVKNARRTSSPNLTIGQQVIVKAPRAGDSYLPITTAEDYNFGYVASALVTVNGRSGYDVQLSSLASDVYNFVPKDIGVL